MKNPFEDTTNYENENRNGMAYWFPLLKQIKMRVPKTILVHTGDADLSPMVDGQEPTNFDNFYNRLVSAIDEMGTPCFLRSGMTSNKHAWDNSCYVTSTDKKHIARHIYEIVEYSYMANIAGLPLDYSIWAVRDLIKTKPLFTSFQNMPITKERRVFIKDGKVQCNHPYWLKSAFDRYSPEEWKLHGEELAFLSKEEEEELTSMATYVGKYFTGYWSVDFLQDVNGDWWLTDMAVGDRSFHHPECKLVEPRND